MQKIERSGIRVLVVDDSHDDVTILSRYLEKYPEPVEVTSAGTGEEAIQRLRTGRYDFCLLDLNLPGISGLDLLEHVLKHSDNLPTLVITGQGDEKKAVQAMKLGVHDYLIKDEITPALLNKTVLNAIESHKNKREKEKLQAQLEIYTGQLEKLVIEKTKEIEHVMAVSPALIYSCGIEGDRFIPTFISSNIKELLGYEVDECMGDPKWWISNLHPEDRDKTVTGFVAEIFREDGSTNGHCHEYRFRRKGGSYGWIRDELKVVRDEEGNPAEIVGSWTDISDSKHAEDELRKLSLALKQSPASIVITDTEGTIEYVNPKFSEITGYSCREAVGQNPRIMKSGHQSPEFYRELWDTITSGKEWSGELLNKKKSGELFWESASISPIVDENGKTINFVAVKEDITERKRVDEEMKKLEARLRQAQKMETIGVLAGGIAHDFNNILMPIMNCTQLVREELPEDSDAHESLGSVLKAADRASDLVQQILTFSRQSEQNRRLLQINSVAAEALKLLKTTLPSTIEMRQHIDPGCGEVLADPTQMHQVLMNLCVNAYHAIQESGGLIEVSLGDVVVDETFARHHINLQPCIYVRLSVTDTGHGIDDETLERIFDPFFSTKGPKGTGLGLSVVHGIVINHGGEIIVESEPGKGSSFHVYLPRASGAIE